MVEIAWADGHVDAREKKAVCTPVNQLETVVGSMDHDSWTVAG